MKNLIAKLIGNIKSAFPWYSECHGVFRITDEEGRLLEEVQVLYRVGMDRDWLACGKSTSSRSPNKVEQEGRDQDPNFIQVETVFHGIGEPVSWQFVRPGFVTEIFVRETGDLGENEGVELIKLRRGASVSHLEEG